MSQPSEARKETHMRAGYLAAAAAYAVLATITAVALNLGALTTGVVVLLPICVVLIALVLSSKGPSAGGDEHFQSSGATTTAEFSLVSTPDAAKETIKANIRGNRRFELVSEDPMTLLVKARVSALTWGEDITIRLHAMDGGTRVEAECRHRQGTAIVDFGQSKRDLKAVLHGLDRLAV